MNRSISIVFFVLALFSCWINFSDIQRFHHADSLVPSLMSLEYWTPYFWGQERVGALSSLLTMPIRDPAASVLVRSWLGIFSGIASIFAVMFYLGRESWVVRGSITTALILLIFPQDQQFRFFIDQDLYGEALLMGLAAALLFRPEDRLTSPRGVAAVLLLVLAHWVNVAVGTALAPLVGLHGLLTRNSPEEVAQLALPLAVRRSWWERLRSAASSVHLLHPRLLLAIALAFLFNIALARFYQSLVQEVLGVPRGDYGFAPVASWPRAWGALLRAADADYSNGVLALVVAAACLLGIAALHWPRTRPYAWGAGHAAFVMLAAAASYFLAVAANAHVAVNAYNSRYLVIPVLLLLCAVTTFAYPVLRGHLGWIDAHLPARWSRALPSVTALVGCALVILSVCGLPRFGAFRAGIEERWGGITREAREARCSHLLGDYWTVWPTVFLNRVLDKEQGGQHPLWGLTHRGMATAHQWRLRVPSAALRICIPHDTKPELQEFYQAHFRLPVLRLERRLRHFTLYLPR